MHTQIEARMNSRIEKTRVYNKLFDIGLTAVEEGTSNTGQQQSEASFTVKSAKNSNYTYTIVCYDNDSSAMGITVDNTGNSMERIAHLTTEILNDGKVSIIESYYSLPRSMRSEVQNIFSLVYDLIDEAGLPIKDEEDTTTSTGSPS